MEPQGEEPGAAACSEPLEGPDAARVISELRAECAGLAGELDRIKKSRGDRFYRKTDQMMREAVLKGAATGGLAQASSVIQLHFRANARSMLQHWGVLTSVAKFSRLKQAELERQFESRRHQLDRDIEAREAKMRLLAEQVEGFEADLAEFASFSISAEAELQLLTGSDIRLGNLLVKQHQDGVSVPEGVDALTLLKMQSALNAATGALTNLKIDLELAGQDDDSDADPAELKAAAQSIATDEGDQNVGEGQLPSEDVLRYLQEEIEARRELEQQLISIKLDQALGILSKSAVVGRLDQQAVAETFALWKEWVPLAKQQVKGASSAMVMMQSVLEAWKSPGMRSTFERWMHHAVDHSRTRLVNTMGKEYRVLRTRVAWRERQLIHCQTQLAAVIAERDAIADYNTEMVARALRTEAGCETAASNLGDPELMALFAEASAKAMGAEAIARANIGKVWPDADRCKIAEKNIEAGGGERD